MRVSNAKAQTAAARTEFADYKAASEQAARKAEAAARARETELQEKTDAITAETKQQVEDATRAAAAADAAADGLRKRVSAIVAADRAGTNPRAAGRGKGQQDSDALDLLAGVYARLDGAAGELAAYNDRLKIAGIACERWAATLKPP
jgi:hypothetical protein